VSRNHHNPRAILGLTVLVFLVLSLAPSKFTRWLGATRDLAMIPVAPLSGLLESASSGIRPARVNVVDDEEQRTREQIDAVIDELEAENKRLWARVYELTREVEDLGRLQVTTGVDALTVPATRVASVVSSGAIEVRPGERAGVSVNAVATAPGGLQIVGLVSRTGPNTSTVHILTDRRFEPNLVAGVVSGAGSRITTVEELDRLPRVDLRPTGRGTLVAEEVELPIADRIAIGDTVRVFDGGWPRVAQLLVLGRVSEIRDTDQPLFKRIVVEPELDLSRVRSVLLRMPASEGGDP
jgi:cell shape-determining protein MreC